MSKSLTNLTDLSSLIRHFFSSFPLHFFSFPTNITEVWLAAPLTPPTLTPPLILTPPLTPPLILTPPLTPPLTLTPPLAPPLNLTSPPPSPPPLTPPSPPLTQPPRVWYNFGSIEKPPRFVHEWHLFPPKFFNLNKISELPRFRDFAKILPTNCSEILLIK